MLKFQVSEEKWNGVPIISVTCEEAARVEFRGGLPTAKGDHARAYSSGEEVAVRFHREGMPATGWIRLRRPTHEVASAAVSLGFETGV
jgi:hypothetical protein